MTVKMKCVIPSQNVKIVARAVHSLAKLGDEMYIECTEDELVFRTINMTKSAFGEFRMCRSFFSSCNFTPSQGFDSYFKVTMKSCISVFKNTHLMDKQVENCEIRMKPEITQVIFQMKFINSSVKKYYLPVIENDQLQAQIPSEAPNQMCASSKFLAAALRNFRPAEDEISLVVTTDKTTIRNHLELRKDASSMRTELSYHQSEFENYVVRNPTNVTFCLKELRAVIMFAEPANLPVLISFSEPGSPIVFQVQNHPAYEANYVVSTLQPSNLNISSRKSTSRVADSPQIAVRTPSSENRIQNSSGAGFSFEDEELVQEPFTLGKKSNTPKGCPLPRSTDPSAGKSRKELTKSIRLHLDLPDTQVTEESSNESMPEPQELRKSAECGNIRVPSPQPCTSKQSDYGSPFILDKNPFSGVVSESETSQNTTGSVCRVDTVIQGVDTSSKPPPELLKTVFSRCFSKDHFLNVLVGHDVILEENSDREMS